MEALPHGRACYGAIILESDNYFLRESDLIILRNGGRLTENIFGYYFDRLQKEQNDESIRIYAVGLDYLFKMPVCDQREIRALLGSEPEPRVLQYAFWVSKEVLPNATGKHWAMLIFSRPDNTFFCLTSKSEECVGSQTLYNHLRPEFSLFAPYKLIKCNADIADGFGALEITQKMFKFIGDGKNKDGIPPLLSGFISELSTIGNQLRFQ